MSVPTSRAAAGLSALALAAGVLTGATAPASAGTTAPDTLAEGLFSPLSAAIGADGTHYVTQNFAGLLMVQPSAGAAPHVAYEAARPGTEVGAVSERKGRVVFATTRETKKSIVTGLYELGKGGKATRIANLSAFEARRNPDGRVTYGVRGLGQRCAAKFPKQVPASYRGIVESHPYATYQVKRKTYVADAAANAILKVTNSGKVKKVAVLPGAALKITKDLAGAFGIPKCAVGEKYWFESVPTDVEKGPDGKLYVSSLPGGPEDPSLGARGSIFRVDPKTGRTKRVVKRLMSPTGVAVAGNGDLYVAQLFGGVISKVAAGTDRAVPFAETGLPGDVEWKGGQLYATVNVLSGMSGEEGDVPNGQLVRW